MPVVTITSTKGGTGKTTTTVLLACSLAERGKSVGILDFDENQPLVSWSERRISPPSGITIYPGVNRTNIMDRLQEAAHHEYVLIDGEGSSSDEASFAICASNLVLIPLQKTQLDANEAKTTVDVIRNEERRMRRPIRAGLVFTRCNPLLTPRVQGDILKALNDLNLQTAAGPVEPLTAELIERPAYQSVFTYGGSLSTLPKTRAGNQEAAQSNAEALLESFLQLVDSLPTE